MLVADAKPKARAGQLQREEMTRAPEEIVKDPACKRASECEGSAPGVKNLAHQDRSGGWSGKVRASKALASQLM